MPLRSWLPGPAAHLPVAGQTPSWPCPPCAPGPPLAHLPAAAAAPKLAPLHEAPVKVDADGPVIQHGAIHILHTVFGILSRVVHDEAEAAGGEAVLVQPHHDALHVAHLAKHLQACGGRERGTAGGVLEQGTAAERLQQSGGSRGGRQRRRRPPAASGAAVLLPRPLPAALRTSYIWSSVVKKDRLPT